jgi:RimJ/RimL family protein N-acetyltransferase
MTIPLAPRTITLETPHYIVRTLEPGDATEAWRDWLADPETARNLNARPERLSAEAVRAYIAGFDRVTSHILGIFEKQTGRLIGIRAVYVDPKRSEFLVNVLVGETDARGKGARTASREPVYRYFFEEMNLQTARAAIVGRNTSVLAGMSKRGWVETRVETRQSAAGDGTLNLHHFRLPRDVWQRMWKKEVS